MEIKDVTDFIILIRKTFGRYEDYSGGCYKFHLILKYVFKDAVGYYNGEHVITKIDGQFYDIDGLIGGDVSGSFLRIHDYGGEYNYPWMNKIFKEYL